MILCHCFSTWNWDICINPDFILGRLAFPEIIFEKQTALSISESFPNVQRKQRLVKSVVKTRQVNITGLTFGPYKKVAKSRKNLTLRIFLCCLQLKNYLETFEDFEQIFRSPWHGNIHPGLFRIFTPILKLDQPNKSLCFERLYLKIGNSLKIVLFSFLSYLK